MKKNVNDSFDCNVSKCDSKDTQILNFMQLAKKKGWEIQKASEQKFYDAHTELLKQFYYIYARDNSKSQKKTLNKMEELKNLYNEFDILNKANIDEDQKACKKNTDTGFILQRTSSTNDCTFNLLYNKIKTLIDDFKFAKTMKESDISKKKRRSIYSARIRAEFKFVRLTEHDMTSSVDVKQQKDRLRLAIAGHRNYLAGAIFLLYAIHQQNKRYAMFRASQLNTDFLPEDIDLCSSIAEDCIIFNGLTQKQIVNSKKLVRLYKNILIKYELAPVEVDIIDHQETSVNNRYIAPEVKIYVWRRDHGRCVKCGSQEKLEYDHIIPISENGSSTARNIQLLCEKCNRSKGAEIEF